MATLHRAQLDRVEEAVESVVADGRFKDTNLAVPPGPPERWDIDVAELASSAPELSLLVRMPASDDGRRDFRLELTMVAAGNGDWTVRVEDLHAV